MSTPGSNEISNWEHDPELKVKRVMPYGWDGSVAVAQRVDSDGNLMVSVEELNGMISALQQIVAKLPQMTVNSAQQLRVLTDTNSAVLAYPQMWISGVSETMVFKGQHFSGQRFQQQRNDLISFN